MKILLLGDYSNVHATLAEGLRSLGHHVVVASDGDGWKGYERDVDLRRPSLGMWQSSLWWLRVCRSFRKFRGFDVVQLINPVFLPLRGERIGRFYRYLRAHNGRVFLGAFGMDYYYVKACMDGHTFRYSDFNIGPDLRETSENKQWLADWRDGAKGALNQYMAADCDGIIAGLYEYYVSYEPQFRDKLTYIPFPIRVSSQQEAGEELLAPATRAAFQRLRSNPDAPVRFFVGIQRERSAYKGTDRMLEALERVRLRYPQLTEIVKVESLPFHEYVKCMQGCHVILDQLYSYTPAMNALEAMAHGLVVVGGGEPENYDILGERELRPIINVLPDSENIYNTLCRVVEERHRLPALSAQSVAYVRKHHDHVKVAAEYLNFWRQRGA